MVHEISWACTASRCTGCTLGMSGKNPKAWQKQCKQNVVLGRHQVCKGESSLYWRGEFVIQLRQEVDGLTQDCIGKNAIRVEVGFVVVVGGGGSSFF